MLVLFVLLGAVIGDSRVGYLVAVVAAMSFDFLHTRPYGSLKIADGKDIVTLILLVAVGMIIGEIALRADRIRDVGTRRWAGVRRIHRVAQLAADGQTADDVILAVTAELTETLHLQNCWFERAPYLGTLDTIEMTGSLKTKEFRYTHDGFELTREGCRDPRALRRSHPRPLRPHPHPGRRDLQGRPPRRARPWRTRSGSSSGVLPDCGFLTAAS